MTGFVLLFAVACLGGVIATVGDRIGMKVGKSRLSLFNLRPRQTATLVSVATGMVASFSTLMLLIALDDQLRKGLFQLDDIQQELAEAQTDLEFTQAEKDAVESTLAESTLLQAEAQTRLLEINESLQTAIDREEETLDRLLDTQSQLGDVSEQANSLRDEINGLRSERQALIDEQANVLRQIAQRDREISQRNAEIDQQDQELAQRDAELSDRDAQIAQRNQEIAERENRLAELQTQQAFLSQEIARLEEEFQGLRLGNVAIGRNETLALTITRANSAENAQRAVDDALSTANRIAVQTVLPGIESVDAIAIRYDPDVIKQIVESITDSQNYVIRVSSAANYIVGEPCVNAAITQGDEPCLQVNVDFARNEVRFQPGEVLATTTMGGPNIRNEVLIERFTLLRATAEFQARRNGIIRYQPIIANGLSEPILEFLSQVQAYDAPVEVRAVANQPILTTGPVYLDLIAVQNNQILFRTRGSTP
ncbi:MAG: DUF3084 domain-containing protein [Phormidesmis sp. RL_2_1]|nr:DUF3084 domain-containing protein [Phormidesmis sp. RL_2_1]